MNRDITTDASPAARLLARAQRLQALAQAGLAYSSNAYDVERYQEIRHISAELAAELSDEPLEKILRVFASGRDYPTPKVDVRAVVTRGAGELLMVREKIDAGRWTLPGGWADIGYTPFENAAKEAREETGLAVRPVRLLALLDKRCHAHPPQPWYVYKIFVGCTVEGGALAGETSETSGARWFAANELAGLELSEDRVTHEQLKRLMELAGDANAPVWCD